MEFLKNHPFAVTAHFDSSIVLTFAIPKAELKPFIPECLELETFENKWAFIAVAMVQTRHLRPKVLPRCFGSDFFLVGYRIFVKYTNKKGKKLRGLYIIKSQTDSKKMKFFGNIFTHYNYTTTDIKLHKSNDLKIIRSTGSDFEIKVNERAEDVKIPLGSPFNTWKEARKFAGPLPFTFTVNTKHKTILTILGVRQNWKPNPIEITDYHFKFLNELNLNKAVLANAFEIKNIPYEWKKGKVERWK
jgi:hypothetical protein